MGTPLESWNGTAAKQAILDFVATVTDRDGAGFVPPEERVAAFDNDGTLWCEQPAVQGGFIMERLTDMADKDTSLRDQQPWKMAYTKDSSWFTTAIEKHYNGDDSGVKTLLSGLGKAFAEMSVDAFADMVVDYFETARHPTYGCSYLDVAYVPMLELLALLDENEFTVYIVSGGGRDFMRPITFQVYGVPPERVIGSAPKLTFQDDDKGAVIMRGAGIDILNDGPAKAIEIWDRTGRRPILAAGNTNGDIQMLQLAGGDGRPWLSLLVSHDDDKREVAYTGGAEKAVKKAAASGWTVISMKDDWAQVFSFDDA